MYKKIIILSLLLSGQLQAGEVSALLKGDKLYWQNAYYKDSLCSASAHGGDHCLVPSFWNPVSELTPTTQWNPGNVSSLGDNLDLPSVGTMSFKLVGIEYHTGSTTQTSVNGNGGVTICTTQSSYQAPMISVADSADCFHSEHLNLTNRQEPFTLFRPIFAVNEAEIKAAFNNNDPALGKAVYHSLVMPYEFKYEYYFDPDDSGAPARTRRYLSDSYSLAIEYIPNYITSVELINPENSAMQVTYNGDNTVTGETFFTFEFTGFFTDGLTMSLLASDEGSYQLNGPESTTINYSIVFEDRTQMVTNNVVDNASLYIERTSLVDPDVFRKNIHISFNVDENTLKTGRYGDTFTVIFEANNL